jgi:hypothetical protein
MVLPGSTGFVLRGSTYTENPSNLNPVAPVEPTARMSCPLPPGRSSARSLLVPKPST